MCIGAHTQTCCGQLCILMTQITALNKEPLYQKLLQWTIYNSYCAVVHVNTYYTGKNGNTGVIIRATVIQNRLKKRQNADIDIEQPYLTEYFGIRFSKLIDFEIWINRRYFLRLCICSKIFFLKYGTIKL